MNEKNDTEATQLLNELENTNGKKDIENLLNKITDHPIILQLQKKLAERKILYKLNISAPVIDTDTISIIHGIERQQDGYISICRKINSGHQDLAGIRVNELSKNLPALLPFLLENSFFSVNASYRPAHWISKITGLPAPARKEKYLRYLNACYCDIDCYKNNFEWSQGVEIILSAQDKNIIPPASIIARSGRGIYLLWLLTSEREGAQQRAFTSEIELYKQINKAIIRSLDNYAPDLVIDKQAFDASRILRIPGSLNTKADNPADMPVNYLLQATAGGRVPVYTLKTLAQKYNIQIIPQESMKYLRTIKKPGTAPERRRGRIATAQYRLNDLLTIAQHIGGFKQGKRRRSISYFCYFLKACGYTLTDILSQVQELANTCKPAYPSDSSDTHIRDIVNNIFENHTPRFRNDYLARFFGINNELANELNLHSIIPEEIATQRNENISEHAQARMERRERIKKILDNRPGNIPSIRKLQSQLLSEGMEASRGTINTDLNIVLKTYQK